MAGTNGTIFALGDCTATSYAPTAQVASQQGAYLARIFAQIAKRDALSQQVVTLESHAAKQDNAAETSAEIESLKKQLSKAEKLRPFQYSHQGSLAYIGSEKAIADLPFFNGNFASGGVATVRSLFSSVSL